MPWKSKAQMRAAYGGFLGPEMKVKAQEFSKVTPDISKLPEHKRKKGQPVMPDLRKMKK